jgi:hypothetical protein
MYYIPDRLDSDLHQDLSHFDRLSLMTISCSNHVGTVRFKTVQGAIVVLVLQPELLTQWKEPLFRTSNPLVTPRDMCLIIEIRLACGHSEQHPTTCERALNNARTLGIFDDDALQCPYPETKLAWSMATCEHCFQDFFNNLKDGSCIMCRDWMNIRWQREVGRFFERGIDRDVGAFEQARMD